MKNNIAIFSLIAFGSACLLTAQDANQQPSQAAPQSNVQPAASARKQANPQQQLNHLTKKLALTADQQQQILPILTDRDQQVSSIEGDTSLSNKERRAKLLAVRSDSQSKLRIVLTDQQRAAYDQMQEQARERAKAKKAAAGTN